VSPPLVAVAHGSRDPRSAACIHALTGAVRAAAPGLDVRTAFLDLSEPPIGAVLDRLYAEGHREVVVTPLLLGSAYHARTDLPGIVDEATARLPGVRILVADVLGAAPPLEDVAVDRLAATGVDLTDPALGVLLAAVGSSHAPANATVGRMARRLQGRLGVPVVAAFASAARPDVPAALARLRARGAERFAAASWFLAPGLLPDRISALAGAQVPMGAPLGADPRVAELVLHRYEQARLAATRTA
jgi:sirohydrochlorin ferrochelatase